MNPNSRLRHETAAEAELAAEQTAVARPAARDFATPEELLRFDREQTPSPAALAQRLETSLAGEPAAIRPWWRRILK